MIVSVITPDESLRKLVQSDLIGIESEVIIANWKEGFEQSSGQFIYFLEKDSDYRGGLFIRGLLDMVIKSSFRKLAMVCPVIEELSRDRLVYGYKTDDGVGMVLKRPGDYIYPVQIGYIPGSIIRRSALEANMPDLDGTTLQNSVVFSIALWSKGLRIHLDPGMTYQIDKIDSQLFEEVPVSPEVKLAWKREGI